MNWLLWLLNYPVIVYDDSAGKWLAVEVRTSRAVARQHRLFEWGREHRTSVGKTRRTYLRWLYMMDAEGRRTYLMYTLLLEHVPRWQDGEEWVEPCYVISLSLPVVRRVYQLEIALSMRGVVEDGPVRLWSHGWD